MVIVDDIDVWTGGELTFCFLRITEFGVKISKFTDNDFLEASKDTELENLLSKLRKYHKRFFGEFVPPSEWYSSVPDKEELKKHLLNCPAFK